MRMKRPSACAAVDKIEGKRKPEDFIGHRKRALHRSSLLLKPNMLAQRQMTQAHRRQGQL